MKRIICADLDLYEVDETIHIELIFDESITANTHSRFLQSKYTGSVHKFEYFVTFVNKAIKKHGFRIWQEGEPSPKNKNGNLSYYVVFYVPGKENVVFKEIVIEARVSNHRIPNSDRRAYEKRRLSEIQDTHPEASVLKLRKITIDNRTYKTYGDALDQVNKRLAEIQEELN